MGCGMSVGCFFALPCAAEVVCDGGSTCLVPTKGNTSASVYGVCCPVPSSKVTPIQQAPRLSSLAGKTIAIVGGSFRASVTHPELKKIILEEAPDARVLVLGEIGSAGVWPSPGVTRKQKDDFVQRLKEEKVDAVIAGNGGCGLCTPKEMGSCIAAEYTGIPAVMIAAPGFIEQAKLTAYAAGVTEPRVATYPGAFSSHTEQQLRDNTRKVLWPQIRKALTTPIAPAKEQAVSPVSKRKDIVFTGDLAQVNQYFANQHWTDGLPIVPPTSDAVAEFLRFTDEAADGVVAMMPTSQREVRVRDVAVNGVMAGCLPEYMPVLLAIVRAMTDGDFRRTLASTHAWTPYCWLNGPAARQLGIDHEQGEISSIANARIGRFINLAMLNLGGYYVKQNRMGTFGYLMPWCLAEDESTALGIGWLPFHMQRGFQVNENTVTMASALNWGNNMAPTGDDPVKIMELMAWDATEKQQFAIGSGTPCVYRTFLITPQVATNLARGYKTKENLESALVNTALMPLLQRAWANYYANPGSTFNPETYPPERHVRKLARTEHAAETPAPFWLRWSEKASLLTVPTMQLGKTALLVTGDANRNKSMCVPGGGTATVRIILPKKWNELMAQKGYAPLASFYLQTTLSPRKPDFTPSRRRPSPRSFVTPQKRRPTKLDAKK